MENLELLKRSASNESFRQRAKEIHEVEGEVEIDSEAVVSRGDDDGAYVAAWVWVPCEPLENDDEGICRTCSEKYTLYADGYDGECPSCADKTAEKLEESRG